LAEDQRQLQEQATFKPGMVEYATNLSTVGIKRTRTLEARETVPAGAVWHAGDICLAAQIEA
jgi:hypothetical protein